MMEVGTWLHAVTDVLVITLLFGGLPIAYITGMMRGRRQIDPVLKAEYDLSREHLKIQVLGVCGIHAPGDEDVTWACMRVAAHRGYHIHKSNGTRVAWTDGRRTEPRRL